MSFVHYHALPFNRYLFVQLIRKKLSCENCEQKLDKILFLCRLSQLREDIHECHVLVKHCHMKTICSVRGTIMHSL